MKRLIYNEFFENDIYGYVKIYQSLGSKYSYFNKPNCLPIVYHDLNLDYSNYLSPYHLTNSVKIPNVEQNTTLLFNGKQLIYNLECNMLKYFQ